MTARDEAIAAATSLPGLVDNLKTVDPALAGALIDKSLIQSKTPWGTILAGAVTYASAKWGFGWSPELCAIVGGAGVLAGSYIMRAITSGPITGLFTKASP